MQNVLVLDHHAATLHGMAGVLRSDEAYSVLEASTGLQAIETGKRCGGLSLLVTDIEVPDLSGTEVALILNTVYPNLPVLFTGNPIRNWTIRDKTNIQRLTAEFVDILEKPFSISELVMRVHNLTERRAQLGIDKKMLRIAAA